MPHRVLSAGLYDNNCPKRGLKLVQLNHEPLVYWNYRCWHPVHDDCGFTNQKGQLSPSHRYFLCLLGKYCNICDKHDYRPRWQPSLPRLWKRLQRNGHLIMGGLLLFHSQLICDFLLGLRSSCSSCPLYLRSLHLLLHDGGQKEWRRWLWQSSLRLWIRQSKSWLLSWS